MKNIFFVLSIAFFINGCGSSANQENPVNGYNNKTSEQVTDYNPAKGEGRFSEVTIDEKLNAAMVAKGEKIVIVKCTSCHKLSQDKLVGPGLRGVTGRHSAEWVMNFITNTDAMLNKDPIAQAQLEICQVRMPNQNLTDDEVRCVYEYLRKNDSVK